MSAAVHRARRLESAISIFLSAILILIGVVVFLSQFDTDRGSSGTKAGGGRIELSTFVPKGFEVLSETEEYVEENLFEKIDGKAPFYTESGFLKLITQRFASKDDEGLWFEVYVYDMGSARGAFSVYSQQMRTEAELLEGFGFGYKTGNCMYFSKGRYYVEAVGSSESGRLSKSMQELVERLQSELGVVRDAELTELGLFPEGGKVSGSSKLYLKDAFGFEGLDNTFTARYSIEGKAVTAFLSKRDSVKEAKAVAKSYYDFLVENGATVKKAADKIFDGKVVDFYGEKKIVLSEGKFVFGISNAANQAVGEKLAVELMKKLDEEGAK